MTGSVQQSGTPRSKLLKHQLYCKAFLAFLQPFHGTSNLSNVAYLLSTWPSAFFILLISGKKASSSASPQFFFSLQRGVIPR